MTRTRIGEYRIRSGNADVPFWRLEPGTLPVDLAVGAQVVPVAPNDPSTFNQVNLPAPFGVFDVVIRMSEPVTESALTDAQSVDLVHSDLTGQATNGPMPFWEDGTGTADNRVANLCFAVAIPQGQDHFEGTLVLSADPVGGGGAKTVQLPIRVNRYDRHGDLFVAFTATPRNRKPDQHYCWIRQQVVEFQVAAGPPAPVQGVDVDAKLLRDNLQNGMRGRNRRVALGTDASGRLAFSHPGGDRTVLAFPTSWPLILTASKSAHVTKAHLARLEQADIDHNQSPHTVPEIRLISEATARASMANSTVLIDPGHAVVYAFSGARRSQEWFVAHRIGTRVRQLLNTRFGMPLTNLFMTRTAGLGLIAPADLGLNNAPERGANDFVFDPAGRRIRIRRNALGMHHLSDLVLTGDDDTPANIGEADRNRLVTINGATITAIIARMDAALPAGQQVQPGSVRWDTATGRYVCRIERNPAAPGQDPIVDPARRFLIGTGDWFTLDAAMLDNLADRTARWSTARELGSGPAADPATGRPAFHAAMTGAMAGANAADYIRRAIITELDLEEPYAAGAAVPNEYLNKESMGWHFNVRRDYINRKNCDLALTIHENAAAPTTALGMVMLVGQNPVDAAQVKASKVFLKYVDPFDQGLRQGGVVDHGASQLAASNQRRAKHVYFELEFMTSTILDNPGVRAADPSRYQYEEMVGAAFIDRVAAQIVDGAVEFLVDVQGDLDSVGYDASNLPNW